MWLRIILGGLYLAMAGGQLLSWSEMPQILSTYDAFPVAVLPVLTATLIAAELVAGLGLLARPRSQSLIPVWVYTAVTLVWAVLALQAQLRGLRVDSCGCFGVYLSQRLSWFVIAQDALLLVYAGLMLRSARRAPRLASSAQEGRSGAIVHR